MSWLTIHKSANGNWSRGIKPSGISYQATFKTNRIFKQSQVLHRLDAQVLKNGCAGKLESLQCLGPPAAPVQCQHQQAAQFFAQWVSLRKWARLRDQLEVLSQAQPCLEEQYLSPEAELLPVRHLHFKLGSENRALAQVTAPQAYRSLEYYLGLVGSAIGKHSPSLVRQILEGCQIQFVARHLKHVAARRGAKAGLPGGRGGRDEIPDS